MTERIVIGLMSGTSLDGVDAACCRIRGDGRDNYDVTVESFVTESYDFALRTRIEAACSDAGTIAEACTLNVALGTVFADAADTAASAADIDLGDVDAIGSHGQTVRHEPEPRKMPGGEQRLRSTLQIGDGSLIAERTGVTTIADFRTADVAVGGHGAPLVPFADLALLADDESFRIAQNVGGIGNCTALPPGAGPADVTAFDTGPGNMVIDGVVELLTDGERTYDEDGKTAREGTVDESVLADAMDDEYFREAPPKSTGRERFGREYAREFVAACREHDCSDADIVATATALTARSIADAYRRFVSLSPDEIVVSGGGAFNPTLLDLLDAEVDAPVRTIDEYGVGADEKEAVAFALLAAAALDGVPNNVPGATGASRPVVMGKRCPPTDR
ncbi:MULTISPECIES: anhydro-N-acetylmuramic acid kinase [unclassified Haladaptatus]|uniref:anhydro-N-acetylmuramic acid kinase n=1 Tax=unclassified Haladaptatus TaxID=2622732 RepID=UPI00209BC0A9|nr:MULTISPECIES: anhydro-N-acetylmuramic acid kinase [unclassified Haladaptatus]MCO8246744.1 anhydro-N-acetylmuramic acid kinase [Haladaptatus sp. AB643]MCO8256392.1 anhydro-N-acetylmuramic acid kinase [Haladaptatus sp. AB618]